MAAIVHEAGADIGYPDITTAIGFCMGIRREVLQKVGLFDEIFGRGYGEDSDYHFRALSAGYRSVLVSTCFIYHESHASFSEATLQQISQNRPIFDRRWSTIYLNELKHHDALRPLERLADAVKERIPKQRKHDVLFILPTPKLFGGIIVVYELVNRLIDSGLDVGVIIAQGSETIHMDLCFAPYFIPPTEWRRGIPEAAVYVATHYDTCGLAFAAHEQFPNSRLAYLIQGYESWFPDAVVEKVVDTYRAIPNRIVVSEWLSDMLGRWKCSAEVIPNGVDSKMFTPPDDRWTPARAAEPPTVLTMLRQDPQGGWRFTFGILEQIKRLRPDIRVIAVGELSSHKDVREFVDEAHKTADRKLMRKLYQKSDIFFDSSMVQGFGLMGLEAMSSGVAVVTSATGGVREYANEENSLLVPVGRGEEMVQAVVRLIDDAPLRERLSHAGRRTAEQMDWRTVSRQYEAALRALISAEADVQTNAKDILSERRYFIHEYLRNGENENWLLQAIELLETELRTTYVAQPVEEVFERAGRKDLKEKLGRSPGGAALLRMYETAMIAVGRAAHHRISGNFTAGTPFLDHVRSIVPHHAEGRGDEAN